MTDREPDERRPGPPRPIEPADGGPDDASDAAGSSGGEGDGPISVRDLMGRPPRPEPVAESDPRWEGEERVFEVDGVEWSARPAGAGAYGTGDLGTARLLAVHFFREGELEPQREALLPAAVFPMLHEQELRTILDRATPIEVDEPNG